MLMASSDHIKRIIIIAGPNGAGKIYARKIPQWQALGYHVSLLFLRLHNVEVAIDRVAQRVKQGGHDINEDVIKRRYNAGWNNFQNIYSSLVNDWVVYDNSGVQPLLIEWSE